MAIWNSVHGVKDGENVDAKTFNRPLSELAARTDYLKDQLDRGRQDDASIKIVVSLSEQDTPEIGDVVCLSTMTKKYVKAIATTSLLDVYAPSERAFAVGMLVEKSDLQGTVALYGKVDLSDMNVSAMTEDSVFGNGQYYLSSTTPGKITRYPTGPKISLGMFTRNAQASGDFVGDFALLNPQYMDIEAHTHRTYALYARPCGESADANEYDGTSSDTNTVKVIGYQPIGGSEFDGGVAPRLVVGGDWTSRESETYEIIVTGPNGVETPTSWPCYISWRVLGETSIHRGDGLKLRCFGDEIEIGDYGLTVKLEPSPGMQENAPFMVNGEMDESHRTWHVGRESGRGWSEFDINKLMTLPDGGVVRISGSPDVRNGKVKIIVPRKIYKVYTGEPEDAGFTNVVLQAGDTVVIDGKTYHVARPDESQTEDSNDDTVISLSTSAFESWIGLKEVSESVFYDVNEKEGADGTRSESGSVFIMADDGVEIIHDGESVVPTLVLDNSDSEPYAVIVDEHGESYASQRYLSLIRVAAIPASNAYETYHLKRELSFMTTSPLQVGSVMETEFKGVPGAVYRYNIEFDNDLKLHYPPVPRQSSSLMLNGVEVSSYTEYSKAVVFVDSDSIYWRDGRVGRQPWPYPNMTAGMDVPAEDEYREVLHFISSFHSDTGPVTSIRPADGSPVTVKRCGTDEDASVGDLEIDVDFNPVTVDREVSGHKVVKAARNGKLLLGPVVEKIIAGPGITFSSGNGAPDGQGVVTISADGSKYSGDFETVALENAKIDSIGMFPYIRFLKWTPGSLTNVPTGLVAKFHVPATIENAVYRVKFYATVFGETSFSGESRQTAGISMDYNILPDYNNIDGSSAIELSNLKSDVLKPNSPYTLNIPFGTADFSDDTVDEARNYKYTAYDPVIIHNDASMENVVGKSVRVMPRSFPYVEDCSNYIEAMRSKGKILSGVFGVRPGYTVAIRLSRTNPTGASVVPYTGAIGILNMRWTVEQVVSIDEAQAEPLTTLVVNTVTNLRKAAVSVGQMDNSVQVVNVLRRILNALT